MNTTQTFLLIAPWDYQLYVVMEKNLCQLGYEVTVVHNNNYHRKQKGWWNTLKRAVKKIHFRMAEANQTEQTIFSGEKRLSLIRSRSSYDVCLVIRADLFSEALLREAKQRSRQFISFFYDGLTHNQHVLPLIPLFDRFYIFDKTEVASFHQHSVWYAPNFYFDDPPSTAKRNTPQNKVYYISSFQPSRLELIQALHRYLASRIAPIRFDLVCSEAEEEELPAYARRHFNCLRQIVPYEEQLELIRDTELILDCKMSIHSGFSFRIFDGINLRKKVITTNALVMEEDFYHPANFYIVTEHNLDGLEDFMNQPYVPLDEGIRAKYSFANWLKTVTAY